MLTTFKQLRDWGACKARYRRLRRVYPGRQSVSLLEVLESNGLGDVMWIIEQPLFSSYREEYRLLQEAAWMDRESVEAVVREIDARYSLKGREEGGGAGDAVR